VVRKFSLEETFDNGSATARAEISSNVLIGLGAAFRRAGLDLAEVARPAGIDLEREGGAREQLRLRAFVQMLELAGARSHSPAVLWRCGRQCATLHFETQFPAARNAVRLGDALRLVELNLRLLQTDSLFRLQVRDGLATFEYRVLEPSIWPRARDVEFTFGYLDGIVSRFVGEDFRPEGVVFEHTPDRRKGRIDSGIGLACVYGGASNVFAFPAELLSRSYRALEAPCAEDGPAMHQLAAALTLREQGADLLLRMRRAVFSMMGGDRAIDQQSVAHACGLSTRSLRRQLAASGQSFREEVARLRMEYAREAIVRTELSMGEIARRLGYSDQSAFTRAFRRELGVAPTRCPNPPCAYGEAARAPVTRASSSRQHDPSRASTRHHR
jgi:AraC-like DNA-binding protein